MAKPEMEREEIMADRQEEAEKLLFTLKQNRKLLKDRSEHEK